jgi:hypothetical protein
MSDDHETAAAVAALVWRLRNRNHADDEPFAQEVITMLLGRGWRPTQARRADWRDLPKGDGMPPEDIRQELDELRARLAARGTA